jgi:hypothetical protein
MFWQLLKYLKFVQQVLCLLIIHCCAGLEKYCNEEQKMKYLVPLARRSNGALPVRARGQFRYFSKLLLLIKETIIC